jgi:hypothetical protein
VGTFGAGPREFFAMALAPDRLAWRLADASGQPEGFLGVVDLEVEPVGLFDEREEARLATAAVASASPDQLSKLSDRD